MEVQAHQTSSTRSYPAVTWRTSISPSGLMVHTLPKKLGDSAKELCKVANIGENEVEDALKL